MATATLSSRITLNTLQTIQEIRRQIMLRLFVYYVLTIILGLPAVGSENSGSIEGRIVWADNTPVAQAQVKLVDKIEVVAYQEAFQPFPTRVLTIAADAVILDHRVDDLGRFRFGNLSPGIWYLFFRVPGAYDGDGWLYRYNSPGPFVVRLPWDTLEMPLEYEVKSGTSLKIPIEVIKRLSLNVPIEERPGYYRFSWGEIEKPT